MSISTHHEGRWKRKSQRLIGTQVVSGEKDPAISPNFFFRLTSSLRSRRSLVVGTPTLKEGIGYRGSEGAIATAGQGALVSKDERRPIPRRPLFMDSFYFGLAGAIIPSKLFFDF